MGQHGAHLGPVGPRWALCWPHEPCYQGRLAKEFTGHYKLLYYYLIRLQFEYIIHKHLNTPDLPCLLENVHMPWIMKNSWTWNITCFIYDISSRSFPNHQNRFIKCHAALSSHQAAIKTFYMHINDSTTGSRSEVHFRRMSNHETVMI